MAKKEIINIVSEDSATSDAITEYLSIQHDYDVYQPGSLIENYKKKHKLIVRPNSKEQDIADIHIWMAVADQLATARPIINHNSDRLVVDGLMVPASIGELKKLGMVTVAITAKEALRTTNSNIVQSFVPNLDATVDMADIVIDLRNDYLQIRQEVGRFLAGIGVGKRGLAKHKH